MKKQDIKKDPIRDQIINGLQYLDENRNVLYTSLSIIGVLLLVFILFNNRSEANMYKSNYISSTAQNYHFDEQFEMSKEKFNEILENSYNQEAKNQAIIYMLKDALDTDDEESFLNILDYKFKTNDNLLYSLYNKIKADYYYNNNEYKNAISYYNKSLKNYKLYKNILIDAKISLANSYFAQNMDSKANNVIDSVDEEELSIQSKNRFLLFINSLE